MEPMRDVFGAVAGGGETLTIASSSHHFDRFGETTDDLLRLGIRDPLRRLILLVILLF